MAGQGQSTELELATRIVTNVRINAISDTWYAGRECNMPIGLANSDAYTTLSAMITPAIFLTANASLIISTSNRVSRVVDRIRVLSDLADKIGRGVSELDFTAERLEHVNSMTSRGAATGCGLR
jgi:Protein of unknown function (DUF2721)